MTPSTLGTRITWLLLGSVVSTAAAQWVVDPSGGGTHTTIQSAINDSTTGQTITVHLGTYRERIDFLGKDITVRTPDPEDEQIRSGTVIDGQALGHVVTFGGGETANAVLEGFTLTNGSAEYGGGIYCTNHSSPTLRFNLIISNFSVLHGTGIHASGGGPLILSNEIRDNIGEGRGPGIFIENSSARIENNVIDDNFTADSSGGGIHVGVGCDAALIVGNEITENTAVFGGGLNIEDSSPLVARNWIVGNVGLNRAGGISCIDASPRFRGNVIAGNWSIYAGAVDCNNAHPSFRGNSFVSNWADSAAVILGINGSTIELTGNLIVFQGKGTAVQVLDDCSATVAHNCLFGNSDGDFIGPVTLGPGNLYVDPLIALLGVWQAGFPEGGGGGDDDFRLFADIAGQESRSGSAEYRLEPDRERFEVSVVSFPSNTVQTVYLNSLAVGQLHVGPQGFGELDLDTNDSNLPPSFPQVVEGDWVNIGGLATGVLLPEGTAGMTWLPGDEHLTDVSPCIDVWSDADPAEDDLDVDGQSRPQGPAADIGADEVVQ